MSKKVLGRGLDALIPKAIKNEVEGEQIVHVSVGDIAANPNQPRKHFDQEKIESLSASIRNDGVLQPIVVRRKGDKYELVMGERRLQAARLAGVPTVPALVKVVKKAESLRLALVENIQRENLNPIEVGQAYRQLMNEFDLTQNEVSEMTGKSRSSIANTVRLLSLPEEVRGMIAEGSIGEGHARALLSLTTGAEQVALARRIVKDKLNVRQVEGDSAVEKAKREEGTARKKSTKPAHVTALEDTFSQHLGTRVVVDEKRGGKGRITIEFYSHEEFERLTEQLSLPLPR